MGANLYIKPCSARINAPVFGQLLSIRPIPQSARHSKSTELDKSLICDLIWKSLLVSSLCWTPHHCKFDLAQNLIVELQMFGDSEYQWDCVVPTQWADSALGLSMNTGYILSFPIENTPCSGCVLDSKYWLSLHQDLVCYLLYPIIFFAVRPKQFKSFVQTIHFNGHSIKQVSNDRSAMMHLAQNQACGMLTQSLKFQGHGCGIHRCEYDADLFLLNHPHTNDWSTS